jgi:putative transcriptional regulator
MQYWVFWNGDDMEKQYRHAACAAIHETIEALHDIGAIDDTTMREFHETCLGPVQAID